MLKCDRCTNPGTELMLETSTALPIATGQDEHVTKQPLVLCEGCAQAPIDEPDEVTIEREPLDPELPEKTLRGLLADDNSMVGIKDEQLAKVARFRFRTVS